MGARASFWTWFAQHAANLESCARESRSADGLPAALAELDRRVGALGLGGAWEIGPDGEGWFFALSPCGCVQGLDAARALVREAPTLPGWTMHPAKPPKTWKQRTFSWGDCRMSADAWRYQLRRWEDGALGLLWVLPADPGLGEEALEKVGQFVLESELGEAAALESFADVEVLVRTDGLFESVGNPIADLRAHFAQLQAEADAQAPAGPCEESK